MAHIVICLVTKSFVSEYTFILSCFKNRIVKLIAGMIRFEKLIREKICNQKDELTFTLI